MFIDSRHKMYFLLFLLLIAIIPTAANACGHERWAIKTGTDRDAHKVVLFKIVPTTIQHLVSLHAPAQLPLHHRIKPVEFTVYTLDATLVEYKREKDDDYHLVLKGDNGNTMIAEIPSPRCVGSRSPFAHDVFKARRQFNAHNDATTSFQHVDAPVTVTGVGFFDFQHGQTGVAPNVIELHPVLDIQFDN